MEEKEKTTNDITGIVLIRDLIVLTAVSTVILILGVLTCKTILEIVLN